MKTPPPACHDGQSASTAAPASRADAALRALYHDWAMDMLLPPADRIRLNVENFGAATLPGVDRIRINVPREAPTNPRRVKLITPTVGRVVHFRSPVQVLPTGATCAPDQPLAAIVAHVHSDRMVNLAVCDPNGSWFSVSSVQLLQPGDAKPEHRLYCEWMAYQKGQAARTEELERDAARPVDRSFGPPAGAVAFAATGAAGAPPAHQHADERLFRGEASSIAQGEVGSLSDVLGTATPKS